MPLTKCPCMAGWCPACRFPRGMEGTVPCSPKGLILGCPQLLDDFRVEEIDEDFCISFPWLKKTKRSTKQGFSNVFITFRGLWVESWKVFRENHLNHSQKSSVTCQISGRFRAPVDLCTLALTPWPHSQAEPSSTDPEVSQLGESGLVGGIQGQISLREAVADASYTVPWRNELGFSGVFYKISGFLEFFLLPGMSQLIFRYSDGQTNSKAKRLVSLVWNWLRWRRRAALLLFCLGRRKMTRRLAAWSGELDLVETWSSAKIQNPAWHSVATSSFVAYST